MVSIGVFDMMDKMIADELSADIETYIDVIDNKCTDWECKFIVHAMLSNRQDKREKAKRIFDSYTKVN